MYNDKCDEVKYDIDFTAKDALNKAIGCMHRSNLNDLSYRLDHVAAIILGRAAQKMLDNYEYLTSQNIPVYQIVVDGIIYGSPIEIGVHDKKLGSLDQEITDAKFVMRGSNAYMFFNNTGKLIQEKHGSYDKNILTDKPENILDWGNEVE